MFFFLKGQNGESFVVTESEFLTVIASKKEIELDPTLQNNANDIPRNTENSLQYQQNAANTELANIHMSIVEALAACPNNVRVTSRLSGK